MLTTIKIIQALGELSRMDYYVRNRVVASIEIKALTPPIGSTAGGCKTCQANAAA